jgi:hypothetical protein
MSPVADGLTERVVQMTWRGPVSAFLRDETRYLDIEGAFRSGKTTACCWKVFNSAWEHAGMHWLICRWTDSDTHGILKPVWRKVLETAGIEAHWDASEHCDILPNGPDPARPYEGGSKVYIKGVKPQQETSRYGKLRGMTLAGVYNDQTEELPYDFYLELKGRLSQKGYPHQMLLSPNPEFSEDHYLAKEFPESNTNKDHKYFCVSIYDNAPNLQAGTVEALEAAYPPGTAKHRPAILGKRGVKVLGKPVYQGAFSRKLHEQPYEMNRMLPLLESIDFGKHHPCVVWAQLSPWGSLHILGAVMGLDLFLDEFAPIILTYRNQWFPTPLEVQTCCDPAGSHNNSQGIRNNGVTVLRDLGFAPVWKENSNALDIRSATIERLSGHMLRRTRAGEGFTIHPDRQLLVNADGPQPSKFLTDGFEAGYVWDENMKSVAGKPMRAPKKDGWYEHGQNCTEYLEINYGGAQMSEAQMERHASRVAHQQVARAQRDSDPYDRRRDRSVLRGGYSGRYR